jgi:inorganic pyrophosphatase
VAVEIEVVVEIPKGSRNKYEMDHETGALWLDRHLFTATTYPADYGFIPGTLSEDGDPLDALVLLDEPTVPGCHILARAIGVFWMRDEAGPDAKILSVPARDERWAHLIDLPDLRRHLRAEISHFFEVYKALEPAKSTEIGTWDDAEVAARVINEAFERYRAGAHDPPPHG